MEARAFDRVIDVEPLEEAFLHFSGTEGEPITDIVKEQTRALGKQAARKEALQRDIADMRIVLNGKQIENISVEDKQGISASVPTAGQFQRPASQGKTLRSA